MKNIIILLIFICIGLVSCDGRKSKHVALQESIEEFNKKQTPPEIISYYPEKYTEIVTDTIISNQIKIHIKNYSLENENVLISTTENQTSKKINYHRVFESEIVISDAQRTIFSTHISTNTFKKVYTGDSFWSNATLQHVWVNQELSNSEQIQLDIAFINPRVNTYKLYRMSVDTNGQQEIHLIEDQT